MTDIARTVVSKQSWYSLFLVASAAAVAPGQSAQGPPQGLGEVCRHYSCTLHNKYLSAAPSAVCPFYVDQAVRGLQVLGSASIGQLLVTGLETCNVATAAAAAAAAAHSVSSLHVGTAGSSAMRAQLARLGDDCCATTLAVLQVLCGLPAAQELPAAAVQQLLLALAALMSKQTRLVTGNVELHKIFDEDAQLMGAFCGSLVNAFMQSFQSMYAWVQLLQQLLSLPVAQQVMLQSQQHQDQPLKDCIIAAQVRPAAVSGCV
jgi:hypothetical protein